jgi:hypothetical protein
MVCRDFHSWTWMRASGLGLLLWTFDVSASTPEPPICSGTLTYCRPCSSTDDGQPMGCTGATPICETTEPNTRFGYCVQCTSNANCSTTTPICTSAGPSTDTCRACSSDTDCSSQLVGKYCLTSGACSDAAAPDASSCSTGPGQPSWLACILFLAGLLPRRRAFFAKGCRPPTELVRARLHASPSRIPASEAMRSAKRCP